MKYILVLPFTLIPWALILASFYITKGFSRIGFVLSHYILDVALFGISFWLYYKYMNALSPFAAMCTGMISLFVVEFIVWRFIYKGDLWFLNFWDWIVPVFLVASTIYLVSLIAR